MNARDRKPQHESSVPVDFAIVGLGRIGSNLARHAVEKGLRVAGYDRARPADSIEAAGVMVLPDLDAIADCTRRPRIVMLYVPAGPDIDELLDRLTGPLDAGDIVIDGGNSYWGDSIRRAQRLTRHGIFLLDAGTSGGVDGAHHGACFMVGGDSAAVAIAAPLLQRLATPGGYVHAGDSGAGHFTKLVHNGIEFGMLQAIGEGIDLLEHYPAALPIAGILECWRHGSVIRSWLVDLIAESYRTHQGLAAIAPQVEDTGEVNWLIDDALHLEVAVPVISQAVMQLLASRDETRCWARAIAAMRNEFGEHPFGRDAAIAHERRVGRVGGFLAPDSSSRSPRTPAS